MSIGMAAGAQRALQFAHDLCASSHADKGITS
jgi:hypothetical protein